MTNRSCKAIQALHVVTSKQVQLFLIVTWETSYFDIQVTTLERCWKSPKKGIQAPVSHTHFTPTDWLAAAKEALYEPNNSSTRSFRYMVEYEVGDESSLQLWWPIVVPGLQDNQAELTLMCTTGPLEAVPVLDRQATLESIMVDFCDSYQILKGSVANLSEQNAELARQRDESQKQLKEEIEKRKERENELFGKFTLVLNSKKEHLRQLSEQLKMVQEEVARLTEKLVLQGGDIATLATTDDDEISDEALDTIKAKASPPAIREETLNMVRINDPQISMPSYLPPSSQADPDTLLIDFKRSQVLGKRSLPDVDDEKDELAELGF